MNKKTMSETNAKSLITTVIPTYRRPKLLRRAILSVLGQTYPHVRVCVYDNASGDETRNVVSEISVKDSRVSYFCHKHNIGSYANFNYGMKAVETPFFSLLSDDDVLAPAFYETAINALKSFPDAMFAVMATMVIDSAGQILSAPIPIQEMRRYSAGEGVEGMIRVAIPNTWTGIVFKREVPFQIGYIDKSAGPFADGGFVWHAAARFPFVVAPGLAAVLMSHVESTSGTIEPINKEWPVWWERMICEIEQDIKVPEVVRQSIRKWVRPNFRKIGAYQAARALAEGNFKRAMKIANGLAGCGYTVLPLFLRTIIYCCQKGLLSARLFKYIKSLRCMRLKLTQRELTSKYQSILSFVDRLSEM
jgi:glycosyltransferase involved in cell wall biosynthesis